MTRPVSVVLAGGGTAGHTSPLIATAQEILRQRPDARVIAVGTARGLEVTVIPAAGLPLELIPPVPMPRRPGIDMVKLPFRLSSSISAAKKILRQQQADVVVGFGGYVSTPIYLAARQLRIPIVIHEQNALPGLANKLAARYTDHIYTSFPDTPLPGARYLGIPLRRGITELNRLAARDVACFSFGLDPLLPTVLVSGGSQGAMSINRAVVGARDHLLAQGIQVLHVLGPKNMTDDNAVVTDPRTRASYRPVAFVEAMEDAYAAADLMLGRCGAGTVLETAAVGLPAIFVPYPHGNGEQGRNAQVVVQAGGAILLDDVDCTPEWVSENVTAIFAEPGRLEGMSAASRGVARNDAAGRLAEITLEVAS